MLIRKGAEADFSRVNQRPVPEIHLIHESLQSIPMNDDEKALLPFTQRRFTIYP